MSRDDYDLLDELELIEMEESVRVPPSDDDCSNPFL